MKAKKSVLLPLSLIALALSGCNLSPSSGKTKTSASSGGNISTSSPASTNSGSDSSSSTTTVTNPPISTTSIDWGGQDITDDFEMVDSNGEANGFTVENSVYTITTAGTYTLTGKLTGRVVINAGSSDTVELDLSGVDISSSDNSPIHALSVDKLKIKSIKDTTNKVVDKRSAKTVDVDDQGEGAIAGKCDMNFIGGGQLYVEGNYNNGIHTSKDLKIKNTHMRVYGYQHALRGGNSIEVNNNATYIEAVAKTGDGLKSNDAGTTSKGKQKGNINLYGGTIIINAYNDGIDAAYNVNIASGTDDDTNETTIPSIAIYTETYATLTKSVSRPGGPGWDNGGNTNKSATTAKGIKGANAVNISEGNIYIYAYDDGIHANTEALTDGDDVATGVYGEGNITISGGNVTIDCTDDGMHADNVLSITGGSVIVTQSYEGLEGHEINISGGEVRVTGSDDGINAGGDDNPSITISGGFVEVTVSPNGDTDGIDSNGTFTQSGGIVITKGPNNQNSSALDHEGTAYINGGTLIVLGAIEGSMTRWGGGTPPGGGGGGGGNVTIGSGMNTYNLSLHSQGNHSITVNGVTYTFTNSSTYSQTTCYSDTPVTGS